MYHAHYCCIGVWLLSIGPVMFLDSLTHDWAVYIACTVMWSANVIVMDMQSVSVGIASECKFGKIRVLLAACIESGCKESE